MADQGGGFRPCDDIGYSITKEFWAVFDGAKLQTWGRISKMVLDIRDPNRPRSFVMMGHVSAYKQLPIDSDQANLATAALRRPKSPDRFAF